MAKLTRKQESRWPTMNDVTIKLRHMPDVQVGASVSLDSGRPTVDFRLEGDDEQSMTPAEARRLAAALVKAATCCDAKTAAARAWRSSPVTQELEAHSDGRSRHVGRVELQGLRSVDDWERRISSARYQAKERRRLAKERAGRAKDRP